MKQTANFTLKKLSLKKKIIAADIKVFRFETLILYQVFVFDTGSVKK
jgi:hypothetical protein